MIAEGDAQGFGQIAQMQGIVIGNFLYLSSHSSRLPTSVSRVARPAMMVLLRRLNGCRPADGERNSRSLCLSGVPFLMLPMILLNTVYHILLSGDGVRRVQ